MAKQIIINACGECHRFIGCPIMQRGMMNPKELHPDCPLEDMPELPSYERIAQELCIIDGGNPFQLEPGDLPQRDGVCPNGDPGHEMWRHYTVEAKRILALITMGG